LCDISIDTIKHYTEILHDFGFLIYFGNNPQLRDFVILKPQWLYDLCITVHRINEFLIDKDELIRAWDKYPPDMHNFLLHLLEKFNLIIDLHDLTTDDLYIGDNKLLGLAVGKTRKQIVLIPDHLPQDMPSSVTLGITFNSVNFCRVFRFPFSKPNGLLEQIIFHMFQYASVLKCVWGNGVEFVKDNITVLCHISKNYNSLGKFSSEDLEILVKEGTVLEQRIVFYDVLEILNNIIETTTKDGQKVESFVVVYNEGQRYPISWKDIQNNIANNDSVVPFKRRELHLEDIVPELVIPEYIGMRFTKEDPNILNTIGKNISDSIVNEKTVTLKKFPELPNSWIKFRSEVAMLTKLIHPSIIAIQGICLSPHMIAYEYCSYGTLFTFIHDEPSNNLISPALQNLIALDIAQGLKFLHGMSRS